MKNINSGFAKADKGKLRVFLRRERERSLLPRFLNHGFSAGQWANAEAGIGSRATAVQSDSSLLSSLSGKRRIKYSKLQEKKILEFSSQR